MTAGSRTKSFALGVMRAIVKIVKRGLPNGVARAAACALLFSGFAIVALAAGSGYHLLDTYKFSPAPGSTGSISTTSPWTRLHIASIWAAVRPCR